jgi:hypothetical protein
MSTLNDELATGLSIAGETLMENVWRAVDGDPVSLKRLTAALGTIRLLGGMFEQGAAAT